MSPYARPLMPSVHADVRVYQTLLFIFAADATQINQDAQWQQKGSVAATLHVVRDDKPRDIYFDKRRCAMLFRWRRLMPLPRTSAHADAQPRR